MEKMLELLEGMGGTPELAEAFQKHLQQYTAELKSRMERDYQEAVNEVKQVCIEEVNEEKAALAKKVEIFVESKAQSMEQAAAKQRAMEETEATSLLKRTKGLLEGISVDDDGINQKVLAMEKKVSRLEAKAESLREERDQAIAKANEMAKAAKHFAEENRKLASHTVVEEDESVTEKAKPKRKAKKVEEGRRRRRAPRRRRLDEGRKARGKVGSTRRTLVESQAASRTSSTPRSSGVDPIEAIASDMPV